MERRASSHTHRAAAEEAARSVEALGMELETVLEAGEGMLENVQAARRREREDAAAQLAAAAAREAALKVELETERAAAARVQAGGAGAHRDRGDT